MSKRQGLIFVISAPSGCGKTTLVKHLLEQLAKKKPQLVRCVSVTNRKPRQGEKNHRDYHFVTLAEFKKKISRGAFLEWQKVFGHDYYGTPRDFVVKNLKEGKDVLLVIDVKGARKIKKMFPQAVLIFILPPSRGVLEERLRQRSTEKEALLKRRLKIAQKEISFAKDYNYRVVNDKISLALRQLKAVVQKERKLNG
jgi:guanylate kinase